MQSKASKPWIYLVFYVFSLNSDSILTTNVHAWPSTPVIVLSVSGELDQILTMNKLHFQGRNPQIQKFCHNSSEQQKLTHQIQHQSLTNHHTCRDKKLVQETPLWSSRCLSSVEISDRNQTCCNQLLRFKQEECMLTREINSNEWERITGCYDPWKIPKKNNYIPVLCYFLNELWLPNIFPKSMIVKRLRTTSDQDSVNHETNKPRHGRNKEPA